MVCCTVFLDAASGVSSEEFELDAGLKDAVPPGANTPSAGAELD